MEGEPYLNPMPGGRWVISRTVEGRSIGLHQDNPLFAFGDADDILRALNLEVSPENLDRYFPHRPDQGRCPTLELMELCNVLDPTNPVAKKQAGQAGV